jgi:hypothetical protein
MGRTADTDSLKRDLSCVVPVWGICGRTKQLFWGRETQMTERILGPQGSPRRRRFLWVPMLLIACTALFVIGSAQAVHDLATGMQLDGNVAHSCPPSPDTGFCLNSQQDWADLFSVAQSGGPPVTTETVTPNTSVIGPTGTDPDFTTATFTRDFESGASCALNSTSTTFCTGDDSTFATGSKDTLDITGWQCNHDNNVNSKIDIMNAYAAAYTNPTADANGVHHKLLYFALEKNKNNGTNDVGFWFLQGGASCSAPSGHQTWSGTHTPGDVLVVSEFSSGGGVSTITAYRWVGGTNPLTQIANATGTLGDCKTAAGADNLCATTNSGAKQFNGNITTPWLTSDATLGVGHTVVPPNFFEGGIDLTSAFANSGSTVPSCFNTFVGDTRSSTSLTATLFDYARGTLGQCSTTLTTSAAGTADGTIGTGQVSSGTDTATLTISGTPTWGGQLTWYLCGPVTTDGCSNTGVQVTSRTVSQASPASDFVSDTATLSSVGRYCWTAHFEPNTATKNAGINPVDDNGANECFNVAPVTPTLVTSASCSASPCVVGSTLSDTATLSNAATGPGTNGTNTTYPSINPSSVPAAGGTISWTAYGPNDCTTVALASTSRNVSGNGTYPTALQTAVSFIAGAPGVYTFVASYSGDSPNTNASTPVTCANQPAGEKVTVTGNASIASAQRWLPNDRVTITGDATLNGSGSITLYSGNNCGATSGSAISGQSYPFTITNGAASGVVEQTGNTTYFVGTNPDGSAGGVAGSYSWLVHYNDNTLTDPADHCETSTVSPITN